MIAAVKVKPSDTLSFFHYDTPLNKGDIVIVETPRGIEAAKVVWLPDNLPNHLNPNSITHIIRKATQDDLVQLSRNREDQSTAFQICLSKIREHNLPMKLLSAEFTLDRNKFIFSFTSDGRVDFRALVRDLAAIFHTRIELRQVGVRDHAKAIGGFAPCGRPLCCSNFLADFAPVSIRMAKDQNLSLNPAKTELIEN